MTWMMMVCAGFGGIFESFPHVISFVLRCEFDHGVKPYLEPSITRYNAIMINRRT